MSLLEVRKAMKKRKPNFIRQDAHKKKRLEKKWRKPRGLHSKMKLKKKGHRKNVSKGYKSPKSVRGIHPSGLAGVLINSVKELSKINKGKEGVIISKKVGLKNKIEIIKEAEKLNIKILNIKDSKEFIKNIEESLKKKKEGKEGKKKEKITKEKTKKVKEKGLEKKVEKSEEELKTEQKKELDKILTTKE